MTLVDFFVFLDWAIFTIMALSVFYLIVFVVASKFYRDRHYPESTKINKVLVLFPAYREDAVILSSVESFLLQNYPKDSYEVVVISDHMKDATNEALKQLPITLLEIKFEPSSKAKALNFALDQYNTSSFNIVTILDADNVVDPCYLSELNKAYASGVRAIQAHRVAKNLQTEASLFDAVSEEVNHSIFRKGHRVLGFSSALVGSGMAFDFNWFKENVVHLYTAGEDKELETLLLKQSIYVEYLDGLYVRDEKISQDDVYYSQRQRWLTAQYMMLFSNLRNIPMCIRTGNFNYLDKIIQWMLLPRVVLFGTTALITAFLFLVNFEHSIKWIILSFLLVLIFVFATPWPLFKRFIKNSWKTVPLYFVMMVFNLFKIKKNKTFIHTPHGQS
jgi:cellulose synthase/poly-beta-1,6-N-acetylglucosamine synthase-like glycosyltransferase